MDLGKKSLKDETNEHQWQESFQTRRPIQKESSLLYRALLGHYLENQAYQTSLKEKYEAESMLDFWDSKRPYGNKDIPASIAYTLGWGSEELLQEELPQFVQDAAYELHELVKERVIKDYIPLEKDLLKAWSPQPQPPQVITKTKVVKHSFVADIREWYEDSIWSFLGTFICILVIIKLFSWVLDTF